MTCSVMIYLETLLLEYGNRLHMHNLIIDMGRDLGKSTRLSWQGNAWNDLQNQELPSGFQPQKLVSLHMPYSNFKILWNGAMPLKSLKIINLNYSVNLKMTPDFGNSKLVKRLLFRGCEGLLKLHPSTRYLTGLHVLDLGGCTHLKELEKPSFQFPVLRHLYSCVKRSLQPTKQWPNIKYLDLGHCRNLRRLPEQLGDMEGLMILDASNTAIEQLPDSITFANLVTLEVVNCKKLRKLPEQIGNMKYLRTLRAGNNAIERLPDSFVSLISLERLDLSYCKNLRNLPNGIWELKLLKVLNLEFCTKLEWLPEELGEMQSLEYLNASHTAIEQVSDSIGLLSRLQRLDLSWCEKLEYLPNSIWNLTSLTNLDLLQADTGIINFPDTVKNTKLVAFGLNCNIRLWLHVILSFSSLKQLCLCDESESLSLTEQFSLSKLSSLQSLELYHFTSVGTSFPELPPSLTHLSLCYHATLVHLPDLSSLKQVKKLDIIGYVSIKSLPPLPPLPPHLRSLTVYDCTSLQDQSDMSMLKELVDLSFGKSNPESISLKQSFLQVIRRCIPLFKADVPRIADWLSYKSSGCTLCFDIPPLFGDNFLGLAIWVLFTSKYSSRFNIEAVITNKTNGMKEYYRMPVYCIRGAAAYSLVKCIRGDEMSVTSGDSIEISFERQLYSFAGEEVPFDTKITLHSQFFLCFQFDRWCVDVFMYSHFGLYLY